MISFDKFASAVVVVALLITTIPAHAGDEWQSMSTAPRDGTVIEIKNSYGVMPWYDIYKWADTGFTNNTWCASGVCPQKEWQSANRPGHSLDHGDEKYMQWRPFKNTGSYIDPTNGAQNTTGYWTGTNNPTPLGRK